MIAGSVWLVRHGETDWSRLRLHTSVTDVPLTERGMEAGREIGSKLAGRSFALVLRSPRLRARQTAELAGEIDVKRAEAALSRAEERLKKVGDPSIDRQRAQQAYERAMARLQCARRKDVKSGRPSTV